MRRSPSKLLFFGFVTVFMILLVGGLSTNNVTAQPPVFPTDFVNDGTLFVYAGLDGQNVNGSDSSNPIVINMEGPMELYLQINVSSTVDLNMTGTIVFYYQGIAVFPIQVVNPVTNSTWIWLDHNNTIPPVTALLDLAQVLTYGPIQLATGLFEASLDFSYYLDGDPVTLHTVSKTFYFSIPASATSIITSVTGISAIVGTIGAVYGLGNGFMTLFEGLKTAYKLRGIHKKASELKSLPNLTVIGALPLLFSMLAGMTKMGKKKQKDDESHEDSGVSEYLVRQRLREVAPAAWPVDKCPKCKRDWNKKIDTCKKCNFTQDDARSYYADHLSEKVPAALKVMGKKKSTDIRTLAKKTKSTDYNAGVIAAAMVDTGVTEIVKVGTPLRSFVMNIAGLAFLVVTWQQLLGDSASTLQTTITLVGAAMSLAIIVALYVNRKTQVQKFSADMDAGKKWIPTEEEAAAEAAMDGAKEEAVEPEDEAEVDEYESVEEDVASEEDVEEDATEFEEEAEEESHETAEVEETEIESESDEVKAEDFEEEIDEPEEDSFEEDEDESDD
ncbi:MAG: hypothetical protein E4H14_04400 [Candidatus Thorarchaeota archaeon]|nr:MAG: hypothetical protein E4H14_04400 [Candidatus Thorarchaeota archaeon]